MTFACQLILTLFFAFRRKNRVELRVDAESNLYFAPENSTELNSDGVVWIGLFDFDSRILYPDMLIIFCLIYFSCPFYSFFSEMLRDCTDIIQGFLPLTLIIFCKNTRLYYRWEKTATIWTSLTLIVSRMHKKGFNWGLSTKTARGCVVY